MCISVFTPLQVSRPFCSPSVGRPFFQYARVDTRAFRVLSISAAAVHLQALCIRACTKRAVQTKCSLDTQISFDGSCAATMLCSSRQHQASTACIQPKLSAGTTFPCTAALPIFVHSCRRLSHAPAFSAALPSLGRLAVAHECGHSGSAQCESSCNQCHSAGVATSRSA